MLVMCLYSSSTNVLLEVKLIHKATWKDRGRTKKEDHYSLPPSTEGLV